MKEDITLSFLRTFNTLDKKPSLHTLLANSDFREIMMDGSIPPVRHVTDDNIVTIKPIMFLNETRSNDHCKFLIFDLAGNMINDLESEDTLRFPKEGYLCKVNIYGSKRSLNFIVDYICNIENINIEYVTDTDRDRNIVYVFYITNDDSITLSKKMYEQIEKNAKEIRGE